MSRRARHRRQHGHTLMELLIALSVSAVVLGLATRVSASLGVATRGLGQHARNLDDLELVLAHLRQDLGAAETVSRTSSTSLHVRREAARAELLGISGEDPGIAYGWRGGQLMRQDLALDDTVVLSRRLEDFRVDSVGGVETHVSFRAGVDDDARELVIVWSERP